MTGLRDARLQKALESAPDADLRPVERVRQDILAMAHRAVAPAPAVPWWKVLWDHAGRRNSPWNAAFATLVVAGFITVLWFDREIPGAREELAQTSAPPPPAAAPVAPAVVPAPAAEAPVVAAAPPARTPPADRLQARKSGPAPSLAQGGAAQDAAAPSESLRERRADTKALRDEDTRALAKSVESSPQPQPQPPLQAEAAAAPPESMPAAAGAAAPRAAPMARSAAPAPAFAPAPAAPAARQEAAGPGAWTRARIASAGREVDVERSQAERLAGLLGAIERGPQGQEPLEGSVTIRIELSQQGATVDLVEVAGAQVRWTRQRAGQRWSFVAKPEPAQLQALQAEVGRLLGR